MEFEDFTKLLFGANSPIPEQNELHEHLMQFESENYAQYISYNLMILNELSDSFLSQLAITILFGEARVGKIFEDQEIAESFLQSYLSLVPNLYQSELFEDNIKLIVSATLSALAIKMYQLSEDTTIQQYIIQIFQSNQAEYETLTISSIMEIVVGSEGLGGFDESTLSDFLVMPLQQETSYVPRCKLFFGVVINSPDSAELSQLFETMYLQSPIPNEYMNEYLKTIIAFSEKHGDFFEPYISTFIPQLCEIAANSENDYRNLPLFIFSALSTGAPKMCQSMSEFYEPVINCLVQIMSEISNENTAENDPENPDIYTIAREQLSIISDNSDNNTDYYNCIESICLQAIASVSEESGTQDDPGQAFFHVPWPLAHAIVAAYCEVINRSGFLFVEKSNFTSELSCGSAVSFIERFIPLLKSNETVPVLRIEILRLISIVSTAVVGIFQQSTAEFMLPIFKELILTEENPAIKLEAAITLKKYFKSITPSYLQNFFPDSFDEIIKILTQSPQYVYKPLIKCLSHFSVLNDLFRKYFAYFINILLTIYVECSGEDIDLKMTVILSITFSLSKLKTNESQANFDNIVEQMKPNLFRLLKDIHQLASHNQIDEYSNEKYHKVISKLLFYLTDSAAQFATLILPQALEVANENIQIEQIQKLDTMNQTFLFTEIQETQVSCRNFALTSDINRVTSALSMMITILGCLKLEIRTYLQDYINTIQKWIINEFQIERIKSVSWIIFQDLIILFKKEPELEQLMNLFFDDFNQTIEIVPIDLGSEIVKSVNYIVYHSDAQEWFDSERISEALVKLEQFSDKTIGNLHSKIEKNDHFTGDHASRDESTIEGILDSVLELYTSFLDKYTELTICYMEENHLIEKMTSLLNSSDSSNPGHKPFIIFSVQIITSYICKTGNVEMAVEWIKTLFEIAERRHDDVSCLVFKYMTFLFHSIEYPDEFLIYIENSFESFLNNIDDENEEDSNDTIYSDWGLPAFALFISTYKEKANFIDYDNATTVWCKVFPIWDVNEITDYAFAFLVDLLNERNTAVLDIDNLYRIIDSIIRNFYMPDFMKEKTKNEMRKALYTLIHDPHFGEKIVEHVQQEQYHDNDLVVELLDPDVEENIANMDNDENDENSD